MDVKSVIRNLVLTTALLQISNALAGGADNPSVSPASLGFAGASSASAENPDTVYFNPAGMVRFKKATISNGLTIVSAAMDVRDDGTTRVQDPRQPPCTNGTGNCLKPENPEAPGNFLPRFQPIPNLFIVDPVSDTASVGLGIFTPLGAKTSYKANWFGSGFVQKSALQTVNINPSLSIKLTDQHSIGMGISVELAHVYQQASVDVPQAAKYYAEAILQDANNAGLFGIPIGGAVPLGDIYKTLLPGPAKDFLGALLVQTSGINGTGEVAYEGIGYGFGWNVGYFYQPSDNTRISLAYRSQISMPVKGDYNWDLSHVNGTIPNPQDLSQTVSARDYLSTYYRPDSIAHTTVIDPQRLSLGLFQSLSPRWDIMGDVSWAGYSAVQYIRLTVDDRTDPKGNVVHQGDTIIPQHWRDTYRVSAGAAYHVNQRLSFKSGLAYDQSPVHDDRYRNPAGPDSDRLVFALGGQYRTQSQTIIDFGYNLLILKQAKASYHEHCTINYYERADNSAGPKDECTANGGDFQATYSNGRVHVLALGITKQL